MSKTKLTPEIHKDIIVRLRAGGLIESVAREVGITPRTIRRWMNRGSFEQDKRDKGGAPNTELDHLSLFFMDVNSALAEAEGRAVVKITSSDDWRAAAWFLEHKFPKKWGKQLNVHLENEYERMLDKLERLLSPSIFEDVLIAMATPDDIVGTDPLEQDDGEVQPQDQQDS